MKQHTVTIRLSNDEFERLQQGANSESITVSQYIREKINGVEPIGGRDVQEAVSKVCRIYTILEKYGLDVNDDIIEGLNEICQILY